mgnify:FL=1
MFLLIGYVVVLLAALGTYAIHGSLLALWVPTEYAALIGMDLGYFLASNSLPAIKATLAAIPAALKGPKGNKAYYIDVLALLFELLSKVRKEGLMSIEGDVENPESSAIFGKYPQIAGDHHLLEFICDYLRMMVGGNLNVLEVEALMEAELEVHHHESLHPSHAVAQMGDATPGFGIVVAVMGVVNVMGSVGQPPAVLGKMIGGALVGTFAGLLICYGFIAPLANVMAAKAEADSTAYKLVKQVLIASMSGYAPQTAIEFGRKILGGHDRPGFVELESELKSRKG